MVVANAMRCDDSNGNETAMRMTEAYQHHQRVYYTDDIMSLINFKCV